MLHESYLLTWIQVDQALPYLFTLIMEAEGVFGDNNGILFLISP